LDSVHDHQQLSRQLTAATGRVLEPGHVVRRVKDGAVFDALEALIRRAQRSIHVVMYIWKDGVASDRVVEALREARARGVPVRIVVDHSGSHGGFVRSVKPRLEELGCDVRLFHALHRSEPSKLLARNHRKGVVVDGQWGLCGGFAIWDVFLGDGRQKDAWRDTNLLLQGPGVRWMQQAFLESWLQAGGELPPLDELPWPVAVPGGAHATAIASSPRDRGTTGTRALLRAVLTAPKKRLWIAVAYFAPDEQILELLTGRAKAGVDVRLLLPGPIHDVPMVRDIGRGWYRALLRAGVRVFEYQASMLHSKAMVVDQGASVVGSMNLGSGSLEMLEELGLVVWDPGLNQQLAEDFAADLEFADEIFENTIPLPLANPARRVLRRAWSAVGRLVRGAREGEQTEAAGGNL
jgi:cardiolipin synthase